MYISKTESSYSIHDLRIFLFLPVYLPRLAINNAKESQATSTNVMEKVIHSALNPAVSPRLLKYACPFWLQFYTVDAPPSLSFPDGTALLENKCRLLSQLGLRVWVET